MCYTMNIGSIKFSLMFLFFCYFISLLFWVDYAYALKIIKAGKYRPTSINSNGSYTSYKYVDDDPDPSTKDKEQVSFFHKIRIPLCIFLVLLFAAYAAYFALIFIDENVFIVYDKIFTYCVWTLLGIVAFLIVIYGIRLTYISYGYLNPNLRKVSIRVTTLSCISGALIVLRVAWSESFKTRSMIEYGLNKSWIVFVEQFLEIVPLAIMAFMLRSSGKKTSGWKEDMKKRVKINNMNARYKSMLEY